ncbi:hypothetical protein LIER_14522 [Lithospermum erythrorhizon]|uniref:Uncharacterized protein n=1 Tax=Lithospermum erythrorhizon TaxID=34254 RepID=A0AAV3PZF0_LITER
MEVMIPIHEQDMDDFDFNTTPSRLSAFYQEFDDFNINYANNNGYDDFAFGAVQEEMNNNVVATAADLFEGGIIKPINTKPRRYNPISSTSEVELMDDKLATKRSSRGRERSSNISSSSSSKRGARSLSPEHAWEEIEEAREHSHYSNAQSPSVAKPPSKSHRKWRFKDLFLFRSASEGRASEKDKHSLFSSSRRRAPISAQELMQDKENRGAKEELNNKTCLPYKHRSFWNNGFYFLVYKNNS